MTENRAGSREVSGSSVRARGLNGASFLSPSDASKSASAILRNKDRSLGSPTKSNSARSVRFFLTTDRSFT